MRGDLHLYLESESLFERLRDHFDGLNNQSDSLQVEHMTFHPALKGGWRSQESSDHKTAIFMDDAYECLPEKLGQFDYVLWLNKSDLLAPAEMPEHDLDISGFENLTNLASTPSRPSTGQCLVWWEEWRMPENVQRHVTKVAEAAYKLAVWMRHAGMAIDPILTHRAGLVHDLDKIQTLQQPGQHGHVSAEFLAERGYPKLADIVRNHLLGIFLMQDLTALSWEMKLVNFCDKLVEGDRIVTLPVRFSALKQRYPHSKVLLDSTEPYLWKLNDEICSILALDDHESLISELNA